MKHLTAIIVDGQPIVVEGAPAEVAQAFNAAGAHMMCAKLDGGARVYVNPARITMLVEARAKSADELDAERARGRIALA